MRAKPVPTNRTEGETPIGNLGDITLRALETLAGCDIIACEDTRITRRLTERYGISALLKPYHEHNAAAARPKILEKLAQGASIAGRLYSRSPRGVAFELASSQRSNCAAPGACSKATAQ